MNIQIFFITSYKESFLNNYSIYINGKEQNQFFLIEKGDNKDKFSTFVNSVEIPLEEGINAKIPIIIKKINDNEKEKNYFIEIGIEKEAIVFIFDYLLKAINEKMKYINFFLWNNSEKYLNKNISKNYKFLLFYKYLLSTEKNINNYPNYYIQLVKNYIKEIERNKEKEKINIEIVICILITSYYEENFYSLISLIELNLQEKKIDISDMNINLIPSFKPIFFSQIYKCLDKLKKIQMDYKNDILEIIIIYFAKYDKEEIYLIFEDLEIKKMIINIFKLEKPNFIIGDILGIFDEEITELFFKQCPNIEYILGLLKKSDNYISYLQRIDNNFERIFNEVISLESLKGVFNIDFDVSISDEIHVLIELHNSLLNKQKEKNKYFISFISIIKKYYTLYLKYNYLEGLCSLEKITFEELKIFKNLKRIKDLNANIMKEIKDNLKKKIENKDLIGKKLINILYLLKHHFNDNDNTFIRDEKKKYF